MNDEPGIDLSNPEPGGAWTGTEDEYKGKILEMIVERPWIHCNVQSDCPTNPLYTFDNPPTAFVKTGPGSVTITITVPL